MLSRREEPTEFLRRVVGLDGSVMLGQSHSFATICFNKPMVIGTMRLLHGRADQPVHGAQEVAGYVNALAAELALMAARSGLHKLNEKLVNVAADAGQIAMALQALPTSVN